MSVAGPPMIDDDNGVITGRNVFWEFVMSVSTVPHAVQCSVVGSNKQLISLSVFHHNPLIAEGLTALAERSGFKTSSHMQNGRESETHVTLLDIELLVDTGARARFSKQELSKGRFIVVTSFDQLMFLGHLIPERIMGVISSKSQFATYRRAIETVASSKQFIAPELKDQWKKLLESSRRCLTARQLQIVRLVAKGSSSRQIADTLGLSPSTIENHRSRILQRIGVRSSAELVLYAEKRGWV